MDANNVWIRSYPRASGGEVNGYRIRINGEKFDIDGEADRDKAENIAFALWSSRIGI